MVRPPDNRPPDNRPPDNGRQPGDDRDDPAARNHVRKAGAPARVRDTTTIDAMWRPLPLAWMTEPPPPRRWLLRRPTRDGKPCPASMGDGLLPLGAAGLLVADGGTGKSIALLELALAVATGRPWLEYFHVAEEARQGRVVVLLAEEDQDECHRRVYAVASFMNLAPAERELVAKRVVVLPLYGRGVQLVGDDGRPTQEWTALQGRLERERDVHGWSLVAVDPFSRVTGADAEADTHRATQAVQTLESLILVPGRPTVLIAHHASLAGVQTGEIRARGVTGIRNAGRWEASLRSDRGGAVVFKVTKNNYAPPMSEELRLVRCQGGVLRVETEAEAEARQARQAEASDAPKASREALAAARREGQIKALMAEIVEAMRSHASPESLTSEMALARLVRGSSSTRLDAVAALLASGQIVAPSRQRQPYKLAPETGSDGQTELDLAHE